MKLKKKPAEAAALVATLVIITIVITLVGVVLNVSNGTSKLSDSSRDYAAIRQAAEGVTEFGVGIWMRVTTSLNRRPTSAELTSGLSTTPAFSAAGFTYAPSGENGPLQVTAVDAYGAPASSAVGVPVHLDTYPGWMGRKYTYVSSVRLQGNSVGGKTLKYGLKRNIEYCTVPLFQAMAFYESDLELYRPATMIIGGLVHTNSTAYVSGHSGGGLTFTGNVSYVNSYTHTVDPPYASMWSGYVANAKISPVYPNGYANQVHSVNRMEPLGTDPASVLNTGDSNPNNDSMRELIEVPTNTSTYPDPTAISERRLYNKAGIIIRINGSTKTIITQNGTSLTATQQTALKNAITQQTIYDRREGKNVDVSSLNISSAKATLEAAAGFNDVLYIYDDSTSGYSDPKAIRLTNGGVLPADGLTVASQNPIYIQGDYNTGTTSDSTKVPANKTGNSDNSSSPVVSGYAKTSTAVIGDAVTILSNNWSDSNSSKALSSRQATNTTVNTAIISGNIPSGWVNEYGVQYGYSGGFNNFPRFLEDWGGNTFTYYGSMVQLYTSKIFTGEWDTGNIYAAPNRRWNFDASFVDNPPPGSLDVVTISRGSLLQF